MKQIIPECIHVEGFKVIGVSERTQNVDEFDSTTAKLPALWQKFATTPLPARHIDAPTYGVYSDYESNETGYYTVTAGVETDQIKAADDFHLIHVKTGTYLVFKYFIRSGNHSCHWSQ